MEALTPPAQLSEWHLLNIENYRTIQAVLDLQPKDDVIGFADFILIAAAAGDLEEKLDEVSARLPEDVRRQMIEVGCIDPEDVPDDREDATDDHGNDIDDATAIRVGKELIVFNDLNWASAQVQNRIAQYIVDKGYGYPTDVVFGATLPLFQGLRRGDSHVTMEIWLPDQDEAWMEARAAGEVISVGQSLGKDWQSSFVIPAYLAEQHPDLDSVDDLKDDKYKELFATAETGGKARLVSCVIGWACEEINAKQIEGYGLSDHVHVVNPGDWAAATADLYGSYEKGEPWLGYQWGTSDPALLLDLVRLEEPEYSDECWFTTKACAYEDATILIAVHPDLTTRAPEVVAMLRAWDFNTDIFKEVARWQSDNADASTNDAALWWLKGNTDLWSGWVTAEAAEAITTALDANETPDGWPTE